MTAGSQQSPPRPAANGAAAASGRPAGTGRATGGQRAVSRAHPVRESVPGRILGVSVGQVMLWQIAVAGVLVAAVRKDWTLGLAGVFAVVVVLLTLVRQRGRWLYQNLAIRMRFRARRRVRPADGPADPRLATLRELVPELDVTGIALRSGERVGVAYDGVAWVGVVAVLPNEDVLPQSPSNQWLPLRDLAKALTVDDIELASVQVIQHTAPAPAGVLPAQSPVSGSYQRLNQRGTPAARHLWVALRLDPARCPDAVEVRGGGLEGGQRAVKRCVARALELLDSAGIPGRALDEEGVRTVLALTGGVRAVPSPPGTRRSDERWSYWQGDGTAHVTWWVRSWPQRGIPMQVLADAVATTPALAVTVSLALHTEQTEGNRFRGLVRASAQSPAAVSAAAQAVEQAASGAGIGLYRLDGEHAIGVIATLPLGGGTL
jgi:type VII secretion protein EccE